MKYKSMPAVVFLTVLISGIVAGCATVNIWSSHPASQTVANKSFEASLEPLFKEGEKFFDRFLIRLKNKTGRELIIDWQQSRYLRDGHENGRFVFEGVTAKNIDNLPSDRIAPGAELSRQIAPVRLIGYESLKSRAVQAGKSGFSAGIIPAGEHGIRLVVKQGQRRLYENILVTISSEKM